MNKFKGPFLAKSPLNDKKVSDKRRTRLADKINEVTHNTPKGEKKFQRRLRKYQRVTGSKDWWAHTTPVNNNEEYHIPLGGVQDVSEVKERSDGSKYVVNTSEITGTSKDTLNIPAGSKDYRGPVKTGDMLDETFYEDLSGIGNREPHADSDWENATYQLMNEGKISESDDKAYPLIEARVKANKQTPLQQGMGNQAKDVPSQESFSVPSHRQYDLGDTWYNEAGPDNTIKATHWGDGSVHTINYPNWEELNLKPTEPSSAYTRRFFSLKNKVDRAKREAEAKNNKNIPK